MSNGVWIWIVIALAVVIAVAAFFIVRRQRYLAGVRALGWSHDSNPSLSAVADLQAPPFGLGYRRSIDELVTGTTPGGVPFRAFEYDYRGAGPSRSFRAVALRLPFALPDVFVTSTDRSRVGIGQGGAQLVQAEHDGLRAISADAGLAEQVLAVCTPALESLKLANGSVDLSVDSNHLVATGAPRKPEELRAFLAALDPVAQALSSSALRGHELSAGRVPSQFHGHPDWRFGQDDGVLDRYPVTRGGYAHRVTDPVQGYRDGIAMDAFIHEWKTDRIETTTDSEGRTTTRTVTENHSEPVCGFVLPFSLPGLAVNGRWLGRKVAFESTDFNRVFKVRAEDPKFASDVIHPRTMEWLLAVRPRGWTVSGRVVVFEVEAHDLLIVDECETVLRGWLGRIPRFVWADLGVEVPPYLVE